jgi:hypothetical protein
MRTSVVNVNVINANESKNGCCGVLVVVMFVVAYVYSTAVPCTW